MTDQNMVVKFLVSLEQATFGTDWTQHVGRFKVVSLVCKNYSEPLASLEIVVIKQMLFEIDQS